MVSVHSAAEPELELELVGMGYWGRGHRGALGVGGGGGRGEELEVAVALAASDECPPALGEGVEASEGFNPEGGAGAKAPALYDEIDPMKEVGLLVHAVEAEAVAVWVYEAELDHGMEDNTLET